MESSKKNLILKFPGTDEYSIEYQSIEEFFVKPFIKKIPPYQRPYSWDKSHVERLLDDISKSADSETEWFIGPIFTSYKLVKEDIRELLDGQQRMTTITLILRSLYFADYLVSEEQWTNPDFKIDDDCEDKYAKLVELRKEHIQSYEYVKQSIIELLLRKKKQGVGKAPKYESKFHTAESTRDILNSFIEQLTVIKSREDFEKSGHSLKAEEGDDFAPTLISINDNVSAINERIRSFLIKKNKPVKDGLIDLIKFVRVLLALTFIEIPLNKDEDVVDIFESINNRGKKLTLSDIIRFRTIKAYTGDLKKQEDVSKTWSEIFRYSSKLSSKNDKTKRYFSTLDTFFERFINAIAQSNGGYTENSQRIERFCSYYSIKGRDLHDGVKEVLLTLKKWDFIVNGDFQKQDVFKKYSGNISSLIQLFKSSLIYSDNSQITFISYLRNQFPSDYSQGASIVGAPYQLLSLFKTTFSISVFHRYSSNEARNIYIWIGRSYDNELMETKEKIKYPDGPYTYQNFTLTYKKDEEQINVVDVPPLKLSDSSLQNILWVKGSDKPTAELILGLYQLMCGETIPDYSAYKWNQLDHVMPEKWFKNGGWRDINSKDLLKSSVATLADDNIRNTFEILLKREDFYSETKWAPTFIQLIGNKVHLTARANREKSNSFWHEHEDNDAKSPKGARYHLQEYFKSKPNDAFIVPYFPEKIYEIDDFNITSIVERSASIVTELVTEFENFQIKCQ